MKAEDKLQSIYDSETHGKIEWFWDGGFVASYGHVTNPHFGFRTFDTAKEAIDWLYSRHVERKALDGGECDEKRR